MYEVLDEITLSRDTDEAKISKNQFDHYSLFRFANECDTNGQWVEPARLAELARLAAVAAAEVEAEMARLAAEAAAIVGQPQDE